MVSHDRALLDRLVGTIVELDRGQLEVSGNYSDFRLERVERRKTLIRTWEKQQDRIRHEQSFIDRYKAGQRARQKGPSLSVGANDRRRGIGEATRIGRGRS